MPKLTTVRMNLLINRFPLASGATEIVKALTGPKYDGKYLHKIVQEKLGNKRLHETLTNVVIPTFDIKRLQPTIFSSYEVIIIYENINFASCS